MLGLLFETAEAMRSEVFQRLEKAGYGDVRPSHGCVFRNVDVQGLRLTEIADMAAITKQAVGEVVSDLELLGYVERVADPADRRAKIIRLTAKGREAQRVAEEAMADVEAEWGERVGADRIAALRTTLHDLVADRFAETSAAA